MDSKRNERAEQWRRQNRTEAERTVMEWIVTGNIPARIGSKESKVKSIDKIRLFNDLRTAEFDSDNINNIIKILKERNSLSIVSTALPFLAEPAFTGFLDLQENVLQKLLVKM